MNVSIHQQCKSARAFVKSSAKVMFWTSLFIALYAIVLPYAYNTAGEPRMAEMLNQQRLADERWVNASTTDILGLGNESSSGAIIGDFSSSASSLSPSPTDSSDLFNNIAIPSNIEQITIDDTDVEVFGKDDSLKKKKEEENIYDANGELIIDANTARAEAPGLMARWFGPDKDKKRAQKEFEEWKKEFKELSGEEIDYSLPPAYLPSAYACVALFLLVLSHALFHLFCHWNVNFKAAVLYSKADSVKEGAYVLVTPPATRGLPDLVPVSKQPLNGYLIIEFQRQVYQYVNAQKFRDNGMHDEKYKNGGFNLVPCPVDKEIQFYLDSKGIGSENKKLEEQYGKNHLSVPMPSFLQLLYKQLLSPLAMFQVFCSILWLLDEYWTYTLWTLVSVVIFEATTVFQRSRTQSMLSNMSPKPSPIFIFRQDKWILGSTKDVLPGDLISLSVKRLNSKIPEEENKPAAAPGAADNSASGGQATIAATPPAPAAPAPAPSGIALDSSNIIPCDCVLLSGNAIVNEASLTGESIPQMKESLSRPETSDASEVKKLDINSGDHKVHVLFSGTTLVAAENSSTSHLSKSITLPPDRGVVAYVLRTGFNSSQGALLQMIEFSQQTVSGDSKEIFWALLLLFIFAIISSAYVFSEGMKKKDRTTHQLLLKSVMIITSVVPRQFPMQMAMAVNMALMALTKLGVMCTEPFRVPIAGKISHCLFDKTGTITTDTMTPLGIIMNSAENQSNSIVVDPKSEINKKIKNWPANIPFLAEVNSANHETSMILAACHSLVEIDGDTGKADSKSGDGDNANQIAGSRANRILVGDPIEIAGLKGVEWTWDAATATATPGGAYKNLCMRLVKSIKSRDDINKLPEADKNAPQNVALLKAINDAIVDLEKRVKEAKEKVERIEYKKVKVVHRHHFSSKLQRMSVVCKVDNKGDEELFSLVKGSPEAIQKLLVNAPGACPKWYTRCYEAMAKRGLRVLALAYKRFTVEEVAYQCRVQDASTNDIDEMLRKMDRTWVESGLYFAGFIAFECKIRADSGTVITSLKESGHAVTMLTGDALQTSLHVAKEVNICTSKNEVEGNKIMDRDSLELFMDESGKPCWKIHYQDEEKLYTNSPFDSKVFSYETVEDLSNKFNIISTEATVLQLASKEIQVPGKDGKEEKRRVLDKDSKIWSCMGNFHVLARMSPQGKAQVIQALQYGHLNDSDDKNAGSGERCKDVHVIMCGDGGNDVGALKQADVGLALLAGHANANTTLDMDTTAAKPVATAEATKAEDGVKNAEDTLNQSQKNLELRAAGIEAKRQAHMKEFQARFAKEQQVRLQQQIKEMSEKGFGISSSWDLMKNQASETKRVLDNENRRFMALHGQVWDPSKNATPGSGGFMDSLTGGGASMDDMSAAGGLPMLRPGDASVAAPFTSRIPSIRAIVDLIRQGRCTLLSALMQQQIMMLESIILAYTMSALTINNLRSSERQMMATSWFIMTASISFSYATPLKHMDKVRPLKSLFHPAVFVSCIGQAAIHIACMSLAVKWATEEMGQAKLEEVSQFFTKVRNHEIDRTAHCGEDDFMCLMTAYWQAPFMPNLMNTIVFLVETSQSISVLFVNYKGRPWMNGIMENHALFLSVFLCLAGVVVASWELVPQLNEMLQLTPLPNNAIRVKVITLVSSTILGTFLWDRLCIYLFAKDIFRAAMAEAKKTSFADVQPILKTIGWIVLGVAFLAYGNLLFAGLAYWQYRNYKNRQAAAEQEAALKAATASSQ